MAKKIDTELEKSMAEEYRQRDPKKAARQATTTTNSLLPATYAVIKIEEDSDDEATADRDSTASELQAKLDSTSKKLNEKEEYIRKLEAERESLNGKDVLLFIYAFDIG